MEWDALEHSYTEKTNDWYASAILIAGSLIAVEFLMNNFLLGSGDSGSGGLTGTDMLNSWIAGNNPGRLRIKGQIRKVE